MLQLRPVDLDPHHILQQRVPAVWALAWVYNIARRVVAVDEDGQVVALAGPGQCTQLLLIMMVVHNPLGEVGAQGMLHSIRPL